ncbi:MAG: hypothetical protein H6653_09330 [Ardenticatenaceae bacterium]|nr:hypothetical protein [Ardenticatenaceae bacterium]
MTRPHPPNPPKQLLESADKFGATTNRAPATLFLLDDNIPFHATRLLLIIDSIGNLGIEGRTKLAKLDFFVRYPRYLLKAAQIEGKKDIAEDIKKVIQSSPTIESQMIRYKYGPWDQKYYLILAYLSGKKLIKIEQKGNVDKFLLTSLGKDLASNLVKQPEFYSLAERCRIVQKLFGNASGTAIKDFIYRHFPEVVRMPQRRAIPSMKQEQENE